MSKIKELLEQPLVPLDHEHTRIIFNEAKICLGDVLGKVHTLLEDLDTFSVGNFPEIYGDRLEELRELFEDVNAAAEFVAGFLEVSDVVRKQCDKYNRKRASLIHEGKESGAHKNVGLS